MEIERRSQCVIEGIDKDKILIRFTHIDPSDLQREFSFVIDVSAKVYKGMQGVKYFKVSTNSAFTQYRQRVLSFRICQYFWTS